MAEGVPVLVDATSGDMIRELESRGYAVFPQARVVSKLPDGWVIMATPLEIAAGGRISPDRARPATYKARRKGTHAKEW